MGLFDIFSKKKHSTDDEVAPETDAVAEDTDDTAEADGPVAAAEAAADEEGDDEEEFAKAAPLDREEKGPFDSEEEAPELNRIDLGALHLPVHDGMQLRLDAEEKTNKIIAVTVQHSGGAMQLQVFAAPTSEGVWNTVRGQIEQNIAKRGGQTDELYTELGRELLTRIPVQTSDGRKGLRIARFAGIDGPRWFIRGVFSGKAIDDGEVRALFVEQFRNIIVHRGTEPMPPRELLPLTAPNVKQPDAVAEANKDDDINPFERGPEITEVR
ncbi:DUF3710 domain-containing protein [Brevibacterium otitidis]|uniref:DUF3710 domain-containing protein n=1 Tax=Brevibacterium otitidis TaxID=53364 RepID=A0ABV5X7D4_9MICO|nr:DUF3710 domain-containing protein [Brevibacterium otitidis]